MNELLFAILISVALSVVISQTAVTEDAEPPAVNCLRRLEVDVMQCTEDAEHKWQFGDNDTDNQKAFCCRNWMSAQCTLKPVFAKCNETEVRDVLKWFVNRINQLDSGSCKNTPFNTEEC